MIQKHKQVDSMLRYDVWLSLLAQARNDIFHKLVRELILEFEPIPSYTEVTPLDDILPTMVECLCTQFTTEPLYGVTNEKD